MPPFYPIFACVDPDLYSEYVSGSRSRKLLNTDPIRIQIQNTAAQYNTAGNLTPRSMIPVLRGVNLEKLEYLGENKTQNENILTHYSVAKADSNYEKNR